MKKTAEESRAETLRAIKTHWFRFRQVSPKDTEWLIKEIERLRGERQ